MVHKRRKKGFGLGFEPDETTYFIGTISLEGFEGVKSKTFNLYKHRGKYLVTNHYGDEFVNKKTYKNLRELRKDFPKGKKQFKKFKIPFLPK